MRSGSGTGKFPGQGGLDARGVPIGVLPPNGGAANFPGGAQEAFGDLPFLVRRHGGEPGDLNGMQRLELHAVQTMRVRAGDSIPFGGWRRGQAG